MRPNFAIAPEVAAFLRANPKAAIRVENLARRLMLQAQGDQVHETWLCLSLEEAANRLGACPRRSLGPFLGRLRYHLYNGVPRLLCGAGNWRVCWAQMSKERRSEIEAKRAAPLSEALASGVLFELTPNCGALGIAKLREIFANPCPGVAHAS